MIDIKLRRLGSSGFSQVKILVIVLVAVVLTIGGLFALKINKSHAGSQVVATIKTNHAGDFTVVACKVDQGSGKYNLQTTASFADPRNVKNGTYATVSSYFIVSNNVTSGTKVAADGKWTDNISANLNADAADSAPSIKFGISSTNIYAKPPFTDEKATEIVELKNIPACSKSEATKLTNTPNATAPTTSNTGSSATPASTTPANSNNNTAANTSKAPATTNTTTKTAQIGDTTYTYLLPGQKFLHGDRLISTNNKYIMKFIDDGNLVVLSTKDAKLLWQSGTSGHKLDYAALQSDGNFVIYSSEKKSLWQSGTNGTKNAEVSLDNAGNLVVSNRQGAAKFTTAPPPPPVVSSAPQSLTFSNQIFANNTTVVQTADKQYRLVMQSDGNLVEYGPNNNVVYSSGTNGNNGASLVLQASDGNMVIKNTSGGIIRSFNTDVNPGDTLNIDTNGNLTVKSSAGVQLWPVIGGTGGFTAEQLAFIAAIQAYINTKKICIGWYVADFGSIFEPRLVFRKSGIIKSPDTLPNCVSNNSNTIKGDSGQTYALDHLEWDGKNYKPNSLINY